MIKAHFLNVGKGNCTVIQVPSGVGVIDIDNSRVDGDDSLTDPLQYLTSDVQAAALFRFVLTHPDMDHMSGLHELAKRFPITNFWDTDNNKQLTDSDWDNSPYDRRDWVAYQRLRRSTSDPKSLQLLAGATSECCWVQDGITVLGPTQSSIDLANESEDYNHLSYVLRLEHAGTVILLGGDATPKAWDEILRVHGADLLKADILLAPHHGSENNTNREVFELIEPDYVIVSVAEGVDYDYDYYSHLARLGVLSTKAYGNLVAEVADDGKYNIYYEHEP